MKDEARATLIAGLPEENPIVGEDMSEDEVKAKIVELQQQIDEFYESKERADATLNNGTFLHWKRDWGQYKHRHEKR